MLLFRLLAPAVLLLAGIAQYITDHVWHDKRTVRHRFARNCLLVLLVLSGVATIVVVVEEHLSGEESVAALKRLGDQAKADAEASEVRDAESQNEIAALRKEVGTLNERLEPFVRIATRKYPDLSDASALKRLMADIEAVRTRTLLLERRIYSFSASAELVLEGEWADGTDRDTELVTMPREVPFIRFVHTSRDQSRYIACFSTAVSRRRLASNQLLVKVEAEVRPGGWPVGYTLDELNDYSQAEIRVALVRRDAVTNPDIILKEARLRVFVNGAPEITREFKGSYIMRVPERGVGLLTLDGVDLLGNASR